MTTQQILAFGVIAGMMGMFAWGRLRYDMVALLTLLVAIVVGIVPHDKAFSGFADEIVVIVASALVVSAAVARSGVIDHAVRFVGPYLTQTSTQVIVLAGAVTVLSAFVKNIGALAMLMPVAFQIARRTEKPVSALLMPMSFGALLGGIVTLIGTSPNIIVSRVRADILGEPFGMFDFTPVGLGIAAVGLLFLAFGWRLLPRDRKGAASIDAAFNLAGYTTEVAVAPDTPAEGKTVGELEKAGEGEVDVIALLRGRTRRFEPPTNTKLRANDIIILQGEPAALERIVALERLKLIRDEKSQEIDAPSDQVGVMEVVVTADSAVVDRSPAEMRLFNRHGINLLAISRADRRVAHRLRTVKLKVGDVLAVQGNLVTMPETLGELGLLPLAQRDLSIGRGRQRWLPIAVLAVAMILVAAHLVPVATAFFGAAVVLLLTGALNLREAYEAVEWPILIMLGALIPVSDALRTTGGTDLIAQWLSHAAIYLPPTGTLVLMMVAAMAVTPFLNNAATVLVVAPIAATFAKNIGLNPDPFLMAVAIGAACDFLTPIGHQCNTLVMGPGGYRFGDYWRLGLPLSVIVVVVGVPLIALFWPLVPR
jgi:di/tricarboxylate transporter